MKIIKDELLERLVKMKLDGLETKNGFRIQRVQRVYFTGVSLDKARSLGATEMKEQINQELLKKLYYKGNKIEGAKITIYISIKEATSSA